MQVRPQARKKSRVLWRMEPSKAYFYAGVSLSQTQLFCPVGILDAFYFLKKKKKWKKEGKEFQYCFYNTAGIINNCLMFCAMAFWTIKMIFLRCCVLARGRGHGVKLHYISAVYYDAPQCLGEFWLKTRALRDFPGCPVARTQCFKYRGPGFNP